ncbi:glycoside hydrolase family 10 protein [Hebeloma cylindrosporum]|uniref:Beta-xylanase n=1 Tax=Hebeloma cylindrosporum TaxID=76867 RepID=A0A0C3C8X3_HEBCY|nr:glycoside hydrolase family 10 protein [Hebeloma cylindrosporum h7]
MASKLLVFATLLEFAVAQSGAWSQCGGIDWGGPTTCIPGWICTYSSSWYSQCLRPMVDYDIDDTTPTSTTSSIPTPSRTPTVGLALVAQAAGKLYFGSATDNPELNDAPYVALLGDTMEFNQITPGNSMKWGATEPSRGTFTFTKGDAIVKFAQDNGQLLRGHNCVWHRQLPSWVSSGNFDNATLQSIVQTHCSTLVGHYKGQIWDVVNEPFNDDGTWRASIFYNTTGPSFVNVALQAARAADPNAKLYINDYNIEGTCAKSAAMANLVKSLKAQDVPIDGVGIQAHLIVGQVPSTMQENIEQFTALGVEVAITELDIRMTLPVTDALLQQQKKDYQTVIAACKAVSGCVGVTVWDYTDKYSWIPSVYPTQGAALPWDANLTKKPAYDGIVAGFLP